MPWLLLLLWPGLRRVPRAGVLVLCLVAVLGPRSGCFAAGVAETLDKRVPEVELKESKARVAKGTGPTARLARLSCAHVHVSLELELCRCTLGSALLSKPGLLRAAA